MNLVLSLLVVVGLILVLARLAARAGGQGEEGPLRVVAARQIAPNRWVQVIEWGGRQYLIGVGDQVTLLAADAAQESSVDMPGAAARPPAAWPVFAVALRRALTQARARYGRPGDWRMRS
ncbi:hypothetical protein GCM10010885_00240 [Alicyclobacillus cellulosilyticus]|uniref:Flagellar protein FliO/FliZ n=1 Tax=Alicyclobacillus cellulosilyticus TaxID=1003997 RepID=A0A917K269_9BACL|nr:flagellar biosynthetic protein FliO [Alicyclobacillus cellulosilyticus]GGI94666.1 hypothetical protein GCM10010885_00240 [Alicyclobacillus cellulosilyticus]